MFGVRCAPRLGYNGFAHRYRLAHARRGAARRAGTTMSAHSCCSGAAPYAGSAVRARRAHRVAVQRPLTQPRASLHDLANARAPYSCTRINAAARAAPARDARLARSAAKPLRPRVCLTVHSCSARSPPIPRGAGVRAPYTHCAVRPRALCAFTWPSATRATCFAARTSARAACRALHHLLRHSQLIFPQKQCLPLADAASARYRFPGEAHGY